MDDGSYFEFILRNAIKEADYSQLQERVIDDMEEHLNQIDDDFNDKFKKCYDFLLENDSLGINGDIICITDLGKRVLYNNLFLNKKIVIDERERKYKPEILFKQENNWYYDIPVFNYHIFKSSLGLDSDDIGQMSIYFLNYSDEQIEKMIDEIGGGLSVSFSKIYNIQYVDISIGLKKIRLLCSL